jgi:glutamate/tyrosine decarboxylase-like PLP-dependent enzyme
MTSDAILFARAAELASEFRSSLPDRPPRPPASAAALRAAFGGPTPEVGEDPLAVIEALAQAADPGLAGTAGPRFFGWVIGASHSAGVAADMLTSAWGQNAGLYAAAPAAAAAEAAASGWLLDILRLPRESSVGFVTGATMASFTCLAAARHRALARVGWDVEALGLAGAPRVRTLISDDAHPAVDSALRYLGLGRPTARVATDDQGRMRPAALREALRLGGGPAIVVAQAGQINTGAFDRGEEIADLCHAAGAWLHVDGAFGLWARAAREFDARTAGLERADSWAVDGHKWLQLPYDSGFAIVSDREAHRAAMNMVASYLPPAAADEHDPGQLVPELSRRARGFPAWVMLRVLGREGVAEIVRRHSRLARRLAERLDALPGVEVQNEVVLNQVVAAFGDGEPEVRDVLTRAVIARLQARNVCFAGGARWRGRWVLRLSLIAHPLQDADIDRLADAIAEAWRDVQIAQAPGRPTVVRAAQA